MFIEIHVAVLAPLVLLALFGVAVLVLIGSEFHSTRAARKRSETEVNKRMNRYRTHRNVAPHIIRDDSLMARRNSESMFYDDTGGGY